MLTTSKKYLSLGYHYQIMLICIAVLTVYYPSIFAEICILDDQNMLNGLFNIQTFDLKGLFFPKGAEGGYYRPLIGLSFYIDRFAWFLSNEIMHFENILLHLLNSLLVFGICCHLSNHISLAPSIPLLTALLFALHPVNTESVNWISGRTDLLAGLFVLISAFIITRYPHRRTVIIPALLLTAIGGLAKETAFAFLPGLFFLFTGFKSGHASILSEKPPYRSISILGAGTILALISAIVFFNYVAVFIIVIGTLITLAHNQGRFTRGSSSITSLLVFASSGLAGYLFFWALRRLAFTSDMPRIATTFKIMVADINTTIHYFLGAMGFYVSKMIWPIPLNFAIMEIDPLYSLIGVLLLMLSIYLMVHGSVVSGLILAMFCMIIPALPLSIGRIAWTPYAERYVYQALPFFVLSIGIFLSSIIEKRPVGIAALLCLLLFTAATVQRNFVWQKNLSLFADVVEKSPNFKLGRGIYMVVLYNQKYYEQAMEQYSIAQSLPSVMYEEQSDLVMAQMLCEQNKFAEAEQIYLTAFKKTKGTNTKVLWAIVSFYIAERSRITTGEKHREDTEKILNYLVMLRALEKDPLALYRAGQIYLAIGERLQARTVFEEARSKLADSDPAKANIVKLLRGLENDIK